MTSFSKGSASPSITRRGFLVAASAASAAFMALPAASANEQDLPITHVIYDHELPAARAFAVVAEAAGARIEPLGADRFRFARDTFSLLSPRSTATTSTATTSTAIMGICSYADFLLLCEAAKDCRAQVSGHIVHTGRALATHKGEGVLEAVSVQLAAAGPHWPLRLAELLTPVAQTFSGQVVLTQRSVPMVSWIITKA